MRGDRREWGWGFRPGTVPDAITADAVSRGSSLASGHVSEDVEIHVSKRQLHPVFFGNSSHTGHGVLFPLDSAS